MRPRGPSWLSPRSRSDPVRLGPRRVVHLDPCSLPRSSRTAQRVYLTEKLAGNLDAPRAKVVVDLEVDPRELHPAHVPDHRGEVARPAARLSTPDRLKRLALLLAGALVDEHGHVCLRSLPD